MPFERDPFLGTISMIESSGGKNTNHALVTQGSHAGTRAMGEWGLMPKTVRGLGYDPDVVRNDPQLQRVVASSLVDDLGREFNDPTAAALAWYSGPEAGRRYLAGKPMSKDEQLYLDKYRHFSQLNSPGGPVGRSQPHGGLPPVSQVPPPMAPPEFAMRTAHGDWPPPPPQIVEMSSRSASQSPRPTPTRIEPPSGGIAPSEPIGLDEDGHPIYPKGSPEELQRRRERIGRESRGVYRNRALQPTGPPSDEARTVDWNMTSDEMKREAERWWKLAQQVRDRGDEATANQLELLALEAAERIARREREREEIREHNRAYEASVASQQGQQQGQEREPASPEGPTPPNQYPQQGPQGPSTNLLTDPTPPRRVNDDGFVSLLQRPRERQAPPGGAQQPQAADPVTQLDYKLQEGVLAGMLSPEQAEEIRNDMMEQWRATRAGGGARPLFAMHALPNALFAGLNAAGDPAGERGYRMMQDSYKQLGAAYDRPRDEARQNFAQSLDMANTDLQYARAKQDLQQYEFTDPTTGQRVSVSRPTFERMMQGRWQEGLASPLEKEERQLKMDSQRAEMERSQRLNDLTSAQTDAVRADLPGTADRNRAKIESSQAETEYTRARTEALRQEIERIANARGMSPEQTKLWVSTTENRWREIQDARKNPEHADHELVKDMSDEEMMGLAYRRASFLLRLNPDNDAFSDMPRLSDQRGKGPIG
jgi:hypothetical protein